MYTAAQQSCFVADYPDVFAGWNYVSSIGAYISAAGAVLFLIMLVVQTGLWFHARQVVEAAAQEALAASQAETASADDGTRAGEDFLGVAGGVRGAAVEVVRDAATVAVDVRGAAPNVLPLAVWNVSASVSGEVERFIGETDR